MNDLSTSCPSDSRQFSGNSDHLQNANGHIRNNPFFKESEADTGDQNLDFNSRPEQSIVVERRVASPSLSMMDSFTEFLGHHPTFQRISSSSTLDSQLVEDHYSDYYPHLGAGSSIQDLEAAVSELKLRVLAECEDSPHRNKMIDRLVDLRQQLHLAKEVQKMKESGQSDSQDSVALSSRTASPNSRKSLGSSPQGKQLQEQTLLVAGHEMVPNSNSRLWILSNKGFCEHCGGVLLGPGRWFFYSCLHCPIMVHASKECRNQLQRTCPLAGFNTDPLSASSIFSAEMLSWKSQGSKRSVRRRISTKSSQNLMLDLESLHVAASLAEQNFQCAECHKALGVADTSQPYYATDPSLNHRALKAAQTSNLRLATGRFGSAVTTGMPTAATYLFQQLHLTTSKSSEPGPPPAARLCHYTHEFYCPQCHWGDQHPLPANVLMLGDSHPYGVSRRAYIRLRALWKVALFRAPDAWILGNRKAWEVFFWRQRMFRVLSLVSHCATLRIIKEKIDERYGHYLLEQPFTFSMRDVMAVSEKRLQPVLELCVGTLGTHIASCETCLALCRQCPVCQQGEILLPHSENVASCHLCEQIAHRVCCSSLNTENRFQTTCLACDRLPRTSRANTHSSQSKY